MGGSGHLFIEPTFVTSLRTPNAAHCARERRERRRRETLSMIDTLVFALFRVFSCVMARVSFRVAMPVAS